MLGTFSRCRRRMNMRITFERLVFTRGRFLQQRIRAEIEDGAVATGEAA